MLEDEALLFIMSLKWFLNFDKYNLSNKVNVRGREKIRTTISIHKWQRGNIQFIKGL